MTGPAIVVRLLTDDDDGTATASGGDNTTERAVRTNCEWPSGPGCHGLVTDIMATQTSSTRSAAGGAGGGAGAAALRDAIQIVVGGGGGGGGGNENNGGSSGGGSIASTRQLIRTATDQITASVRLVLLLTALFDAVQAAKKTPLGSGGGGSCGGSSCNASSSSSEDARQQASAGKASTGADENANANAVPVPKLAATELVKACTATMMALAKSIGNAAASSTNDGSGSGSGSGSGNDGSVTWSVPAAQFALELSYRAFRPIVVDKAQFLQLWRGITDVALASWGVLSSASASSASASSSLSSDKDRAIATDTNRRYYSALSDATITLLGYVKEGTDALWTHLSPALVPSVSAPPSVSVEVLGTDPNLPGKLRHLVKMFVFLLARVAHVLSIMVTTNDDNCCGGSRRIEPLPPPPEVLSSVMNHMARLRGISVRLEIIAERAKGSGEEEALVMLDKIRKDVLEPIAKIGGKADALVGKNLLPSSAATKSKAEQGGEGRAKEASAATVHRAALNALLGVADQPYPSGGDDDSDDGSDDEIDGSTAPTSLALGKLFLLRALLRKLRSSASEESCSANNVSNVVSKEANRDATLSISEDLLFFTLPLCHTSIDSFDSNDSVGPSILLDVVDLVADCTLRNELRIDDAKNSLATTAASSRPYDDRNAHPSVANQTHLLLARWLVPSKKECANRGEMYLSLHPLSREMAISVVHLHTLRLCAMASETGRGPLNQYNSSNTEASSRHLIYLLCQVLIDPRTVAEGRSNVSAVLLRLLSSSSDYSTTFARNESIRCFIDAMNASMQGGNLGEPGTQQPRKAGRKRRRKEIKQSHADGLFYLARHWSAQDIAAVGSVLSIVSAQPTFWEEASDTVKASIQKLCHRMSESRARRRPGSMGLVSHCLAGGLIHGSPINIDINEFHSKIIQVISKVSTNDSDMDADAAVPAMLCFVEKYMNFRKQSYPAKELETLSKACLAFVGGSGPSGGRNVYITHAVASLLSPIGGSISAHCPIPVLKTIASTFHSLFKSNEWPLIAATMSSLLDFLQTVNKAHSSILRQFFPQHLQPMMQSRMQGDIFDLQSMSSLNANEIQFAGESELNLSRARRRKAYVRSDLSFTDKSTAVTITKDGTIGAILIIPQGSSFTMSDIDLSGGFVPNQLGTITHAFATNDGSSCNMQIQDDA